MTSTGGMEQFFTRPVANEGIELPLTAPGSDAVTGHWLRVRGVDSDHFRLADSTAKRGMVDLIGITDTNVRAEALDTAKRRLVAALVCSWSFEQECSEENVMAFFKEAPHLMDAVDRVASNRALFFAKRSSNSEPSQGTSSDLT